MEIQLLRLSQKLQALEVTNYTTETGIFMTMKLLHKDVRQPACEGEPPPKSPNPSLRLQGRTPTAGTTEPLRERGARGTSTRRQ